MRKSAMDAVKTGTTIRLEEVQVGDGGEKAYYDNHRSSLARAHQSAANMLALLSFQPH
ncbi:MAG: hypothetical protein Q9175_001660 [Cornicularia normoerica]